MQIIGVVKDYHQQSLNKDFTPILFALHEKLSWMKQRYISVVMENGNPRDLVKQVEGVWERYFPDSSYDYFFLDQFFDQQYRQDEVFGLIVALFAILAIFISCMGLAVQVMFSCSTRIREMGIRKVREPPEAAFSLNWGEFFLVDCYCCCHRPSAFGPDHGGLAESLFVPHGLESVVLPRSGRFIVCDLLADHRLANRQNHL